MPRTTGPLIETLRQFLAAPDQDHYGRALMDTTNLQSGVLYPLLRRLTDEGWLERHWEDPHPDRKGRARRRLYRLTDQGHDEARRIFDHHDINTGET